MRAILTRRERCTELEDGARQEEHVKVEDDASDNNDLEKGAQPWHHRIYREGRKGAATVRL